MLFPKSIGAKLVDFLVKWHINFLGLFNIKTILTEEHQWHDLTHS